MAVRVAAVQSNRRLSCSHPRDYYLDLFRNSSFDTELRIASYLEVMRCPTYFVTTVVRKTLEEEDVNQGKLRISPIYYSAEFPRKFL